MPTATATKQQGLLRAASAGQRCPADNRRGDNRSLAARGQAVVDGSVRQRHQPCTPGQRQEFWTSRKTVRSPMAPSAVLTSRDRQAAGGQHGLLPPGRSCAAPRYRRAQTYRDRHRRPIGRPTRRGPAHRMRLPAGASREATSGSNRPSTISTHRAGHEHTTEVPPASQQETTALGPAWAAMNPPRSPHTEKAWPQPRNTSPTI
jgi:hypothetical protein